MPVNIEAIRSVVDAAPTKEPVQPRAVRSVPGARAAGALDVTYRTQRAAFESGHLAITYSYVTQIFSI
jgi:hypothetical protein